MTVQTLTITYQVPARSVVDDPLWLRLEQELLAEDIATVADAAAVLDALYELEPCEDRPDNEESGSLTNPPQEDEEPTTADLATAAQTIDYLGCDIEPDGSVAVVVRIIRADPTRPYVLRITGGRVVPAAFGQAAVPVTVQEEHQQHLLVESADSVVLDYPVVSGFSAQWLGPVIGDGPIAKPTINRTGTTLHWDGTVTGTIAVRYLTTYDRATVLVYGVDGKPGEATIRCFCHGLVEELVPELPEPAEIDRSLCLSRSWDLDMEPDEVVCVEDITVYTVCECSKRELKAYTYQQEVACPEWAPTTCPNNETRCTHLLGSRVVYEYVACTDDNEVEGRPGFVYSISQPDYYEDVCCRKPDKPLPKCPEKTISYKGGQPIELGEAHYRKLYGPATRIQPVAPPGGICGEWTIRQVISSSNCCEDVEPLAWDTAVSPEVMTPNSAVIIGVTGGGRYALTWAVSGHGFQFQNGSTRIVTGPNQTQVRLSALPSACGTATITVSDGCSDATGQIRSTSGQWVLKPGLADMCPFADQVAVETITDWDYEGFGQHVTAVRGGMKVEQRYFSQSIVGGHNKPISCADAYQSTCDTLYAIYGASMRPACIFPPFQANQWYPLMFERRLYTCDESDPLRVNINVAVTYPIEFNGGGFIRVYAWEC